MISHSIVPRFNSSFRFCLEVQLLVSAWELLVDWHEKKVTQQFFSHRGVLCSPDGCSQSVNRAGSGTYTQREDNVTVMFSLTPTRMCLWH